MNHRKPNLVFIFADQWRRQSLGFLHEDPVITPVLDSFAAESRIFDHAYACSPICSPNRACLFTGKYPFHTKMTRNDSKLSSDVETLFETFKKHGYRTGYIGKWHMDGSGGRPDRHVAAEDRHDIDFWYMSMGHKHFVLDYQVEDDTVHLGTGWMPDHETDIAIDFIKRSNNDMPFSLFISYAPPHTGGGQAYAEKQNDTWPFPQRYAAPARFEKMYEPYQDILRRNNVKEYNHYDTACILPGYFGAVTSIDENIGRILACLKQEGIEQNTVVIITSDHGDMLGSHGRITKGIWYEEAVGVPLFIRWPGIVKPGMDDTLVNSIDVMPTLLNLMGMPCHSVDGINLSMNMTQTEKIYKPEEIYFSFDNGLISEDQRFWRAIRTQRYMYVVAKRRIYHDLTGEGGCILYDNIEDPYQINPIFLNQGYNDIIYDHHSKLKRWLDGLGDPFIDTIWLID